MTAVCFVEFRTAALCLDCEAVSAAPQGRCARCTSTAIMTLADKLGQITPPAARVLGPPTLRNCPNCGHLMFLNAREIYMHALTNQADCPTFAPIPEVLRV
jgi:hypothetical protein